MKLTVVVILLSFSCSNIEDSDYVCPIPGIEDSFSVSSMKISGQYIETKGFGCTFSYDRISITIDGLNTESPYIKNAIIPTFCDVFIGDGSWQAMCSRFVDCAGPAPYCLRYETKFIFDLFGSIGTLDVVYSSEDLVDFCEHNFEIDSVIRNYEADRL